MEKLAILARQHLNLEITAYQQEQFSIYSRLLMEWNQKINLTAIQEERDIIIKHFFDSLTCIQCFDQGASFSLVDIGTGAGFPGIPIKIVLGDISLTLVESVKKKADFCSLVVNALQLPNTKIVQARAEELGQSHAYRESFDWATARAVKELTVLAEYLLPLIKVGGSAIAFKGKENLKEIEMAEKAIFTLGGKISQSIPITLPEGYGQRTLFLISKVHPTPSVYPRRAGVPSKKPILF